MLSRCAILSRNLLLLRSRVVIHKLIQCCPALPLDQPVLTGRVKIVFASLYFCFHYTPTLELLAFRSIGSFGIA